jgi:hypothetical protein
MVVKAAAQDDDQYAQEDQARDGEDQRRKLTFLNYAGRPWPGRHQDPCGSGSSGFVVSW